MGANLIAEFVLDIFNQEEERVRNQQRFQELRIHRQQIRDTSNPFTLPSQFFRRYYRMSPELTLRLIDLLQNQLLQERSSGIPPHHQVLIALRFLGEGSFQKGFSQDLHHPISQSTATTIINRVVNAINTLADLFIQFPSTEEQRFHISNHFQMTNRIPGILGIVDGFLVTFKRSAENEEAFFNYRVGSSMNVQIVVDSDYNILNIRICPGSNNDRFVWQLSAAKEYMERLRANENIPQRYYILGDSGYTPSEVLLTPDLNAPEGSPAHNYTLDHVSTRCIVEQTIGILCGTWMAINRSRKLYYSPRKVVKIINACAILHNFRRKNGISSQVRNEIQPHNYQRNLRGREYLEGIQERNRVINRYYT